jgi:hypothetical protein
MVSLIQFQYIDEMQSQTANLSAFTIHCRLYAKSYAQEGAMRAAFEMFKTFNSDDAADNRKFAANKLTMPVLTMNFLGN